MRPPSLSPSLRTDRSPTVRMTNEWRLRPSPLRLGLRLAIDDYDVALPAPQLMGGLTKPTDSWTLDLRIRSKGYLRVSKGAGSSHYKL